MAAAAENGDGDDEQLALEVTVLSAESLRNRSSPLLPGRRLRPYVILSFPAAACNRGQLAPIYRTRVDEGGAHHPTWHDTLRAPMDASFLRGGEQGRGKAGGAAVHVSVLSKRPLRGPARLGWCEIPSCDIVDGLWPPSVRRRLSYALRHPCHGGHSHGVIHMAVRLLGPHLERLARPSPRPAPEPGWYVTAIGIPAAAPAAAFLLPESGTHVPYWRR
ncbi:hypothetical protein OPV22_008691 [Ensete ventricosum]|uniref:C2 domain-containing protein n=1 Tax=Ensete ventricosum TaxID=4639 RepID=A0AAV8R908_ENSVE|nr:hypothetical protein OPV22_008691 [Ensete ventricosum]RWW47326.1 hypothetical protein BHE74_00046703 [Ensete ventricosum]